jgi:hypothetical protein
LVQSALCVKDSDAGIVSSSAGLHGQHADAKPDSYQSWSAGALAIAAFMAK